MECFIDAGAPTKSLLEFKLLVNSVISEAKKGARFISMDLKDFFLASLMKCPKYMRIKLALIPADIIEKYNLHEKVHSDGFVYIQNKKGMYRLKEGAILAYE